jgi:uncharacterized membrane protein YfcA
LWCLAPEPVRKLPSSPCGQRLELRHPLCVAGGHSLFGTLSGLIGIGAWTYWKQGDVDIRIAAFICLGFLLGSLLGARVATQLPNLLLGRIFGGATVLIGLRMLMAR